MSSTSMSLESLLFLIQHMEANRRIEIRQRCPSLREFEKAVPLTIKSLVLTQSCVIVNGTTYQLGIIRKYNIGEAPQCIKDSNNKGGITYDVDKYGIRNELKALMEPPGDVDRNQHEAQFIEMLERIIQHREERLAHQRERRPNRRRITVEQSENHIDMGAICLPVGLKLKIEQLMFNGATITRLEVLDPILNDSSFPLKKLDMQYWSDDYATNPMVQTAGILRIREIMRNYLQAISTITNPLVHISLMILSEQVLVELVGHWLESQRPVGYEYIFDDCREPRFAFEMEDILKRLNGVIIDDENVIIPMSDATQLKVSYGPFPEFAPRSKWAVRFLTEAIEH
ncbi:unnamed protein product [Caenorhabditis brenneri]